MSDSVVLLLFLIVPVLLALSWIVEDGPWKQQALGVALLAGMALPVVWMVAELGGEPPLP